MTAASDWGAPAERKRVRPALDGHARRADQFDAVIHCDDTRAVEPLEVTSE